MLLYVFIHYLSTQGYLKIYDFLRIVCFDFLTEKNVLKKINNNNAPKPILLLSVFTVVKTHQFPKTERCKCSHPAPAPCARLSSHSWHSSWTWVGARLSGAPGWPSAGAFWRKWGRCLGGLEMSWCRGTCAHLLCTAEGSEAEKWSERSPN